MIQSSTHRSFFVFLWLCLSLYSATAQSPAWLWASGFGDQYYDRGTSTAVDAAGNVYVTGFFNGTVDFDPGTGVFNLTAASGDNVFICKINNGGSFEWAKHLAGADYSSGLSMAIDVTGNLYVTGYFQGTVDFDPGPGILHLTSAGSSDIFICKMDSSGNSIWARQIGGIDQDVPQAISVQAATGNVYVTGFFYATVDFDPGPSSFVLTALGSSPDIFIAKLDSAGNFDWAKAIGGTGYDQGVSLVADAFGSVYITGYVQDTTDMDPGPAVFNVTGQGFILKLNSSGDFTWAKEVPVFFHALAIDASTYDGPFATGYFQGTVDFDPGPGLSNLISNGNMDIFIVRLDSTGNLVWARSMGGTSADQANSIAISSSGAAEVYTTGSFQGTVDFDPSPGVFNLGPAGFQDIFISKLDSAGNFIFAKAAGGSSVDDGRSIALDASGNAFVTGYFYSLSCAFGNNTLTNADPQGNFEDIFIAKLDTAMVTSVHELKQNAGGMSVIPNPASSHFLIEIPPITNPVEIKIADITGKIVFATILVSTQTLALSTQNLDQGIYFVHVQAEGFNAVKRLVVAK